MTRRLPKKAVLQGFEIRVGPPKLTRFEKARIVGARSLQLTMGAPAFVPIEKGLRDPIMIATSELESGALPISIRRTLPNGVHQDIPIKALMQ
jgi:DNA-directed RNA polymerase I, II, and III subunit RPABC2